MTPPLLPAEAWGAEDAVAPAVVRRVGMGRDVLIPADHAEDARQVDDGPAAAILQHGADLGTAAMKDAREVGVDDRPPALVRAGIDRTVAKPPPTDAGAIERDIERAEAAAPLRASVVRSERLAHCLRASSTPAASATSQANGSTDAEAWMPLTLRSTA